MERRECSTSGIRLICKGLFGGPGRDRTDDLFHAMLRVLSYVIDGTGLISWKNRQKRHSWQHLLPKCCQIHHRAIGLCRGRAARLVFIPA